MGWAFFVFFSPWLELGRRPLSDGTVGPPAERRGVRKWWVGCNTARIVRGRVVLVVRDL